MKKYIWFLLAFILTAGVYMLFRPTINDKVLGVQKEAVPTPAVLYKNQVTFEFNGRNITGAWYKVSDTFNLTLTSNLEDKKDASDTFEERSCKFLSSGGFYTEEGQPTGLFISNGNTLRKYTSNSLLNGILSVNYIGTPRITVELPDDQLIVGLQSGPVLKENAEYRKLSLIRDEESRRVVAGVTGYNELYFIVFYDKSSAYLGPLLETLPDLLKVFESESGIEFADAINLDGGSATAFYVRGQNPNKTDQFSLSEVSPVGSFFCEN